MKPPPAWRARGMWRRRVAAVRKTLHTRASKPKKRNAPNRHQSRCDACQLFVKRLCRAQYQPCGVCPRCCPGGHTPPKREGARP